MAILAPNNRANDLKIFAQTLTTVAASDTIVTGLRKVLHAVASLEDSPVLTCQHATAVVGDQAGTPTAGNILLKTWMSTATGDSTPVPATTFGKKVSVFVLGY